jgi:hypothetical protein
MGGKRVRQGKYGDVLLASMRGQDEICPELEVANIGGQAESAAFTTLASA